jgi:hypothetical protein
MTRPAQENGVPPAGFRVRPAALYFHPKTGARQQFPERRIRTRRPDGQATLGT